MRVAQRLVVAPSYVRIELWKGAIGLTVTLLNFSHYCRRCYYHSSVCSISEAKASVTA